MNKDTRRTRNADLGVCERGQEQHTIQGTLNKWHRLPYSEQRYSEQGTQWTRYTV